MARGIGKRKVGELFGLSLARGKLQQTAIFGAFRRPVSVAHFQCPDALSVQEVSESDDQP